MTQGDPLPRSLTFVIDISSSMQQDKLQAVKGALVAAIEPLSELVGEWSAGQARLFTIGVGQDVDQGFLTGLAEEHRGEAYWSSLRPIFRAS